MSGKVIVSTQTQLEGVILEEEYPKKTQKKRRGYTCESEKRGSEHKWASSLFERHHWDHSAFVLISIHMRPLTLAKDLRGP